MATGAGFTNGTLSAATAQIGRHVDRFRGAYGNADVLLPEPLVVRDGHLHVDDDLHVDCGMNRSTSSRIAGASLLVVAVAGARAEAGSVAVAAVITFPVERSRYRPAHLGARPCRSPIGFGRTTSAPWSLTVLAGGDLISGASTGRYFERHVGRNPGAPISERHAQQDRRAARCRRATATSTRTRIGSITFLLGELMDLQHRHRTRRPSCSRSARP